MREPRWTTRNLKKDHLDFQKKLFFLLTVTDCLSDYKVKCECSNIDFAGDKVLRYKSTGSAMGAEYQVYKECFGPAMAIEDQEDLTKEKRDSIQKDTKLLTKGY